MEAVVGTGTRQVKFAIPKELASRVEELAKRCGVHPVNVVCVGLKMVTDIASDDEGLKFLQERAPLLKPEKVN
jgi:Tat protein secretion system quality control protein TatD with DNase activity